MTSQRAEIAMRAYAAGRRRRSVCGVLERAADALLAAGGLLLANAALPLGLGLPVGRLGLSLGAAMVCAGLAWITRHRGHRARPERPVVIRLAAPGTVALQGHARRAA